MSAWSIEALVVVVPVHDEAELLDSCLSSLAAAIARAPVPCEVRVVLDACTDDSDEIAARHPFAVVRTDAGAVGAARAQGIASGLTALRELPAERVWIANTDADSTVPAHWITSQLELAASGADLVVGTVRPDFGDLSPAHQRAVARDAPSRRSERPHARRESRRPREHLCRRRRLQRTDRARGRPPGRRVPPLRGDGGRERCGRGQHIGALHRAHPWRLCRVPPRPGAVAAPRSEPISSRRETDDERSGSRARCGRHRDLADLGRRRGRGADDPASRVRVGGDHLRFGRHAAARPDARRARGRAGRERRLGGAAGGPSGRRHPYARTRRPAPDRPDRHRARHAGIRHRPGAPRGRGAALPLGGGRAVHRQPERGEHPPLRALRLCRDGAGRHRAAESKRSICASASPSRDREDAPATQGAGFTDPFLRSPAARHPIRTTRLRTPDTHRRRRAPPAGRRGRAGCPDRTSPGARCPTRSPG